MLDVLEHLLAVLKVQGDVHVHVAAVTPMVKRDNTVANLKIPREQ